MKHQDTIATIDNRQLRAVAADNTHGQQQHTVAKQDTQHTTAGKTTPATPRTAPTQGTGTENNPRRATAQHRKACFATNAVDCDPHVQELHKITSNVVWKWTGICFYLRWINALEYNAHARAASMLELLSEVILLTKIGHAHGSLQSICLSKHDAAVVGKPCVSVFQVLNTLLTSKLHSLAMAISCLAQRPYTFVALAIQSCILAVVALPGNLYMDPCLQEAAINAGKLCSTFSGMLGRAGIADVSQRYANNRDADWMKSSPTGSYRAVLLRLHRGCAQGIAMKVPRRLCAALYASPTQKLFKFPVSVMRTLFKAGVGCLPCSFGGDLRSSPDLQPCIDVPF